MNRFGSIAGVAIAVVLPGAAIADDQHVIAQADSLKWTAAPPVLPKGAQIVALYGDPDKSGTIRLPAQIPGRLQGSRPHAPQ
jgi:hypothetical protein